MWSCKCSFFKKQNYALIKTINFSSLYVILIFVKIRIWTYPHKRMRPQYSTVLGIIFTCDGGTVHVGVVVSLTLQKAKCYVHTIED